MCVCVCKREREEEREAVVEWEGERDSCFFSGFCIVIINHCKAFCSKDRRSINLPISK